MEERELCFPHINSSCRKQRRSQADNVLTYSVLPSISLLTTTLNLLAIISISHFKYLLSYSPHAFDAVNKSSAWKETLLDGIIDMLYYSNWELLLLNVFLTFQRFYRLYVILLSQLRQLHTPTNLLMLSLAVSDFLVGLVISFVLAFTDGCWYLGDHICVLYITINSVVITVPVGTMVLISIDRYIAICYPLHYHYKITVRRVFIANVLCWVCSVLYVSVMLWDVFIQPEKFKSCQGECVIALDDNEAIIDFVLIFVSSVTVVIVLYLRVFVVAVSQARAMRGQIRVVTLKRSEAVHVRKSELKAAGILGVVVVAFLSCYFPYFCSSFVGDSFQFSLTVVPLQNWLPYFNSCLNPLIYAFCYPWFKKSVKLLLTLKILRRGSSRLNVL